MAEQVKQAEIRTEGDETVRGDPHLEHVQGHEQSSRWSNGQCVLAVPTSSMLTPAFDLSLCRALLEREGFQVPVRDLEAPLQTALGPASVRRHLLFNSSLFHIVTAPVVYLVVWCAVYSTLHLYLPASLDFWVLGLCVSLISILSTTTVILLLHSCNKQITLNTDVRLVQVNEKLVQHRLLLGVADWVQHCTGTLQLFCVYWDLSPCLSALTQTLEEMSFARDALQSKLRRRMAHLVLVAEVPSLRPQGSGAEEEPEEELEEGPGEERPLLSVERGGSTAPSQREDTKLAHHFSLVPDHTLPAQALAHQLLLTYSAAYVKLLVSDRLPAPKQRPLAAGRTHCSTASLCLCQYIQVNVLR